MMKIDTLTIIIFQIIIIKQLIIICTGQEAPAYTTQKFENYYYNTNTNNISSLHKTNVCERYKSLYRDEITLPNALYGLNISVVLTDYIDPNNKLLFSLNDNGVIPNTKQYIPLFVQIMDEISNRAGFTWRNSYGTVTPINDNDISNNRTWTDLLKWEVMNYDIAMGRWDRTEQRIAEEISFPEGYYDSSIILVQLMTTNKTDNRRNTWSFLDPFELSVWGLIILALPISGLLYYLLERLDASSDRDVLESEPGSAIYLSFITFTGHNEFQPRTFGARIMAFSMTLWALMTSAAYTANLASFLVTRNQPELKYQSVQEAVILRTPICLQGGISLDEYISEKYPTAVLVRKPNGREVLLALQQGECQVALVPRSEYDSFERNQEVNSDCTLSSTGRVEKFVPSGLATSVDTGTYCSSLISHVLDYHLIKMKSDGFFDRVLEEYLSKIGDQHCTSETMIRARLDEDDTFSLNIKEMSGIFVVHAILSGVALLMTLFRVLWIKYHRNNTSSTNNNELDVKATGDGNKKKYETQCTELDDQQRPSSVLDSTELDDVETDRDDCFSCPPIFPDVDNKRMSSLDQKIRNGRYINNNNNKQQRYVSNFVEVEQDSTLNPITITHRRLLLSSDEEDNSEQMQKNGRRKSKNMKNNNNHTTKFL